MSELLSFLKLISARLRQLTKEYFSIVIFIVAIAFNYLPDIAPYYSVLISEKQLHVLGDLNEYAEKCDEQENNDLVCKSQYRIPFMVHANHEALGLGVILFSVNASCSNRPDARIDLIDNVYYSKVAVSLKTYRVLPLRILNCTDDIIIRNFGPKTNIRHGVAQSLAIVGKEQAVWQAKQLVELTISGSLALLTFLFIAIYLVLASLQHVTDIKMSFTIFERYRLILLIQAFLMSGLSSVFYPYNNYNYDFVTRLTQFFGILVLLGPVVDFHIQKSRSINLYKKLSGKTIWAILLLVATTQLTDLANSYSYFIVTIGMLALLNATAFRNQTMLFFGLSIIIDGLKIMMIPGLPASRCSIFFLFLFLIYQTRNQIIRLQENARIEAGVNIALQLAHDIRSPLAVISNLSPKLSGNQELKQLISAATLRIREITASLLSDTKSGYNRNLIAEVCDVSKLCKEVSELKRHEFFNREDITLTVETSDNSPLLALIDQAELRRILSNLLNNSFESFSSSSGKIKIHVYAHKDLIVVEIIDNGCGISEELLESIGTKGISFKSTGNGLGLYFAKRFISQWNGRFEIFSKPSIGTTIKISIPKYKSRSL